MCVSYLYLYVYIYIYLCIHMYIYVCIYIYLYVYVYMCIRLYPCSLFRSYKCVCINVQCIYEYMHIYVCMYIHIHVYIYLCIYIGNIGLSCGSVVQFYDTRLVYDMNSMNEICYSSWYCFFSTITYTIYIYLFNNLCI